MFEVEASGVAFETSPAIDRPYCLEVKLVTPQATCSRGFAPGGTKLYLSVQSLFKEELDVVSHSKLVQHYERTKTIRRSIWSRFQGLAEITTGGQFFRGTGSVFCFQKRLSNGDSAFGDPFQEKRPVLIEKAVQQSSIRGKANYDPSRHDCRPYSVIAR